MTTPLTILGIPGSLRKASFNRMTLVAAQQLVPPDTSIEIFDLHGIPPFNQDHEANPPEVVVEFKRRIRAADAILFATPEYNYSISGVLKNAIDWASRPHGDNAWNNKPAAVISAAGGIFGGIRAHYPLLQTFVFLNMHSMTLPEFALAKAGDKFDAQGNLTDEPSRKLLSELLRNLAEWTRKVK
jgi:chromate reductase